MEPHAKVCGCGWQRCHYCGGADNCYLCHPEKKLLCSQCGTEHTHEEPCSPAGRLAVEQIPRQPAWTVLYNIVTPGSRWIGTAWEFFNDEDLAQRRYAELRLSGAVPTKRPYHSSDRTHLGGVHEINNTRSLRCDEGDLGPKS